MSLPRVLIGLGVLLVAVPTALAIYDRSLSDRIAEGVRVGDVDVGGASEAEAREVVRERIAVPARRDVTVEHGDDEWELTARDARLEVDVEASVQAAVDESREGNFVIRAVRDLLGTELDETVDPRLGFDRDAVAEFAEEVAAEADEDARDAEIEVDSGRLEAVSDRAGWKTDREALAQALAERLEDPRSDRSLDLPGQSLDPDTTVADLEERHPLFLVIDRDAFRLRVYEDLEPDETYRISVGRVGSETPAGRYDISNKAVDPVWYVPDEPWAGEKRGERIPPGPENPIKARWLGIEDGIGIHGTDEPESIGRQASQGCIRMLIPEVKELYDRVPVGTAVEIA
jgi:lipoprotein-anchoring transpeptidase ErfK/SrfK